MKTLLLELVLSLGVLGLSFAGPVRPIRSSTFKPQSLSGPSGDPQAMQGQWFMDPGGGAYPKTWEFHDDDDTLSIKGIVQTITYGPMPMSNIVAFTVLATVVNNLPSNYQPTSSSNSHYEVQSPPYAAYSGAMQGTRIVAEFAVASMALLPSGITPYYNDPVSGTSYYIEATNEDEAAWYCWAPGAPQLPSGNFQVPTWRLGDIPLGGTATNLMTFVVTGPGMPMTDYRHSVIRHSYMNQSDIFYARHPSLKISHWLDTLLVDYYGGSGYIGLPGDNEPEPAPRYIYASDVSVFFDQEMDFGDAPDIPYETRLARDGARHIIVPTVYLGKYIDPEADGQPNLSATGDDVSNQADEDGVVFTSLLTPGQMATMDVECSVSGVLYGWIDYNRNGTWGDTGEQIFAGIPLLPGTNSVSFRVSATAPLGPAFARFRFTTQQPPLSYTGLAEDGEVEDYVVHLQALDFGDAMDGPYSTMQASDGARHIIPSDYWLGAIPPDQELDGQPDAQAMGDDIGGAADEEGVSFLGALIIGSNCTFKIVASTNGCLNAWIDYNRDGIWGGYGEQIATDVRLTKGTNTLVVGVPVQALFGPTYGRFRFSSLTGLQPTGLANDGEVEDYAVTLYQAKPTITLAITNITCNASNTVVTIKWNGESPLVYETHYADVLSTSMTWTAWGSYVSSAPYEQINSISGVTSRFYRVSAPYTAP